MSYEKNNSRSVISQVMQSQITSCPENPYYGACIQTIDIAVAMLKNGMGMIRNHNDKAVIKNMHYPHFHSQYEKAENSARLTKIGVWRVLKKLDK